MRTNARGRLQISRRIVLISAAAWMVLLVTPASTISHAHHPLTESGSAPASLQAPAATDDEHEPASMTAHAHHAPTDAGAAHASVAATTSGASAMLPALSQSASLLVGWAIMLVAMMSPTLIAPICHVIERTFKRRHARSVALFVSGYAAIWMAAGVILIATTLMLELLLPQSYLPAVAVGIAAFVWQCSPIKQRCLNRSHNHRELVAFGRAADLDVLRFGITHGLWCVGSCWLLMLLPMLVSSGHIAVMALVTLVMIGERLEAPGPLRWRLRPRGSLMRLMVVQTQLQWQRTLSRKV